jgi:hypothetical protein
VLNQIVNHEDIRESGSIDPPFLTLILDGGEWSASRHGRFIPMEGAPVPTRQEAGWGPELILTLRKKYKNSSLQEIEPQPSRPQPVPT